MNDLGQVCDLCGELVENLYECRGYFVCKDCLREEEPELKNFNFCQEKIEKIYFY